MAMGAHEAFGFDNYNSEFHELIAGRDIPPGPAGDKALITEGA